MRNGDIGKKSRERRNIKTSSFHFSPFLLPPPRPCPPPPTSPCAVYGLIRLCLKRNFVLRLFPSLLLSLFTCCFCRLPPLLPSSSRKKLAFPFRSERKDRKTLERTCPHICIRSPPHSMKTFGRADRFLSYPQINSFLLLTCGVKSSCVNTILWGEEEAGGEGEKEKVSARQGRGEEKLSKPFLASASQSSSSSLTVSFFSSTCLRLLTNPHLVFLLLGPSASSAVSRILLNFFSFA